MATITKRNQICESVIVPISILMMDVQRSISVPIGTIRIHAHKIITFLNKFTFISCKSPSNTRISTFPSMMILSNPVIAVFRILPCLRDYSSCRFGSFFFRFRKITKTFRTKKMVCFTTGIIEGNCPTTTPLASSSHGITFWTKIIFPRSVTTAWNSWRHRLATRQAFCWPCHIAPLHLNKCL